MKLDCIRGDCELANKSPEEKRYYEDKTNFMICSAGHVCCPCCTDKFQKDLENGKERRMTTVKKMLNEAVTTYREVSGSKDIIEHITSEPKGFFNKIRSVSQNMIEIEAIIVIIFFAFMHESLMAAGIVTLSTLMLYMATQ